MLWSLLLVMSLGELPSVEVNTLSGEQVSGRLEELTATNLRITTDSGEQSLSLGEVLDVSLISAPDVTRDEAELDAVLVDGSKLRVAAIEVAGRQARLTSPRVGTAKLSLSALRSLRFGEANAELNESWDNLLEKSSRSDMLVTRKGDVLDFLTGVVGDINDKTVKFLLDGDEIPVKREKVYGIIYRNSTTKTTGICQVDVGGDTLVAKQISWDGMGWRVALAVGETINLSADSLRSLDFSLGKIRYLSQMEPRDVKYVPYFDLTWKYRRDTNLDGGPIRLGNRTYKRGLAIHSRTTLQYRINGDYRRFKAVMGIDQSVGRLGDVHVVITGDDKELLSADVRGSDAPVPLDLDVTDVRDLTILVDFGGDLDIADHLDLADAKVVK